MRIYITIEEAMVRGYIYAANEEGNIYPLKSMDSLDVIDYPYVVVDGVISDVGLMLSW